MSILLLDTSCSEMMFSKQSNGQVILAKRVFIILTLMFFLRRGFAAGQNKTSEAIEQCKSRCDQSSTLPVPINIKIYITGHYQPNLKKEDDLPPLQRQFVTVYWDCPDWRGTQKNTEIMCFLYDYPSKKNSKKIKGFEMKSDLKSFLHDMLARKTRTLLSEGDIFRIALDIANGMCYIHAAGLIHRNLKAASVFITSSNPLKMVAKVGEFGLAMDLNDHQFMNCSKISKQNATELVQWMASETFEDYSFSTKSDVWSYGVCCWEMATCGSTPYKKLGNFENKSDEIQEFVVSQHGNPGNPNQYNRLYKEVMLPCWEYEPMNRPTFEEIIHKITSVLSEIVPFMGYNNSVNEEVHADGEYSKLTTPLIENELEMITM